MFQFKKLAIAGAVAASVMGTTAAQAHVSYNYATATGGEPTTANTNHATSSWTLGSWTGGSPLDKGYTGNLPATWLANIHHAGDVYEVSKANAIEEGDPDGAGPLSSAVSSSFKLQSTNNKWNPANSWGNALDFGLIDLDVAGNVTIKVQAETGSNFLPGFTLFSGWDTSTTSSKHGTWNVALPAVPVNPRGSSGLTYVGQASTSSNDGGVNYSYDSINKAVEITFLGLNAGKYSLWIGGNGTGNTTDNQQYLANISVAAVPVPGAVWLFGSAVVGMIGIGRRKAAISA